MRPDRIQVPSPDVWCGLLPAPHRLWLPVGGPPSSGWILESVPCACLGAGPARSEGTGRLGSGSRVRALLHAGPPCIHLLPAGCRQGPPPGSRHRGRRLQFFSHLIFSRFSYFFFALPQPQLLLFRQRLLGPRRPSRVLPKVVRRVGHAGPRGGGWAAAPSPAAGTSCPCTPDRSSWVPGLSWGADRGCSPGLPIGAQASPSVWPASPPCARLGLGPGPGRTGTWAAGSQCRPRSFRPASGQRKHVPSQGRRVLSPGPLGTLRSQEGLLEVASAALFLEDGNGWGQDGGGRRVRVEPGQRAGHQCARGQWGPWCVARGTRPA